MREIEASTEFGGEKPDDKISFTKFEIAKLELHEGDMLVLRTDQHLTGDQVMHLKARLNEAFPGIKTMVLTSGLSLAVLQDKRNGTA